MVSSIGRFGFWPVIGPSGSRCSPATRPHPPDELHGSRAGRQGRQHRRLLPGEADPRHTGDVAVAPILMLAVADVARTRTAYWERERERDLLAVTLPD